MSEDYQHVATAHTNDVGFVRIDRPEAMNAVNVELLRELGDAIEATAPEVGTVVLEGEGSAAFIGGGDIEEFQGQPGLWFMGEFREAMSGVETAIESSRVPVIAAVDGVALGGGTEIALMCDLIVASQSATFGLPEIGLGLIPGAGGTQRLAHAVGYIRAKELVLTGQHLPASEAEEIGLVTEVVPDQEFGDRIDDLAAELAAGAPLAQWFAKKSINETRGDLDTGLELEAALVSLLFETADADEGLQAFLEGRDPSFDG